MQYTSKSLAFEVLSEALVMLAPVTEPAAPFEEFASRAMCTPPELTSQIDETCATLLLHETVTVMPEPPL
jgi:hypothetical protein